MKEIENKFIELTKELIGELRKKGLDIDSIKVEIDGKTSKGNYIVNIRHKL